MNQRVRRLAATIVTIVASITPFAASLQERQAAPATDGVLSPHILECPGGIICKDQPGEDLILVQYGRRLTLAELAAGSDQLANPVELFLLGDVVQFPELLPDPTAAGAGESAPEGVSGDDSPSEWTDIVPRVGLFRDLGESTLLKSNYAQYADQLGGIPRDPVLATYGYYHSYVSGGPVPGANPSSRPVPNEAIFSYGYYHSYVSGGLVPDANPSSSPRTNEFVLGAQHGLNMAIGANFIYRARENTIWSPVLVDDAGNERQLQPGDWEAGCDNGGGPCNTLWGDYFYLDNPGGFTAGGPVDLSQPGAFDPVPGGRNPLVQIMIIDQINNTVVQVNVGDDPPVEGPAPVTLWSALSRLFTPRVGGGGVAHAAGVPGPALAGMVGRGSAEGFVRASVPPRRRTLAARPVPVVQQSANGLQVFLTNLGNSTGEAFVMQAFNAGPLPIELTGDGIVVEPLKEELQRQVQQQLQQQLGKLIGDSPVMQRLNAYCLEFLKAPPSPDSLFQIASGELQQQFAPMKHILSASRGLQDAGLLNPDSDPLSYFHAIRQWSIWTREEGFDQDAFADAFVDHTRKQVESMNREWSSQFETTLRGVAPNRWNDIQRVLTEAERRQDAGQR